MDVGHNDLTWKVAIPGQILCNSARCLAMKGGWWAHRDSNPEPKDYESLTPVIQIVSIYSKEYRIKICNKFHINDLRSILLC